MLGGEHIWSGTATRIAIHAFPIAISNVGQDGTPESQITIPDRNQGRRRQSISSIAILKHKTQLETRQLTENETRQYIVSQWISEDFLASDLKPSKILQPTAFLNLQFTFLEKFLEKRQQRQVVRRLLS
ncbi:7196_t:CDS:2 [Acaulospora colombiana]|uniref:7196_t:CDS:1 n=1 Tax=Acaulospora colombiana TaxID=27376 RepID=A0ACA9KM53_9GLOM|nr:7196_t:CDS:2 [Acaulospora colombiana]